MHAFARARRRGCLSGTGRIWGYESACTVHLSVPCTIVRTYPFILHILHPWGLYTGYARMRRLLWVRARARTARRRRRDSSTSRLEGARQRSGRANAGCGECPPVCSRDDLKNERRSFIFVCTSPLAAAVPTRPESIARSASSILFSTSFADSRSASRSQSAATSAPLDTFFFVSSSYRQLAPMTSSARPASAEVAKP